MYIHMYIGLVLRITTSRKAVYTSTYAFMYIRCVYVHVHSVLCLQDPVERAELYIMTQYANETVCNYGLALATTALLESQNPVTVDTANNMVDDLKNRIKDSKTCKLCGGPHAVTLCKTPLHSISPDRRITMFFF